MFDFAWTEIALIGVVALVLIGPKDMPVAIKAVTTMIKKARRMAAEFQTHVDDMVKDTELQDVHKSIREIRGMDIRGAITRAVDKDGSIRSAMADPAIRTALADPAIRTALADPMRTPPPVLPSTALPETVVEPLPEHTIAAAPAPSAEMPAFIPPDAGMLPVPTVREAPAFIPPETKPPAEAHPHLRSL